MTLTGGSLFTGGGGLDYGLELAGIETRWQVEYDPWDVHLLDHGWGGRWRDVPRYRDVRDVDFARVEPVDVLAGGFPCQPVSKAGKRRAQADERWLWPEYARAVRDVRPRFVVVENVSGLLDGHGGLGDVLGDLAALGYDAEWSSFPAAALGAPHLRDRVWIVAYPARPLGGRVGRRARRAGATRSDSSIGTVPDADGVHGDDRRSGRRPVRGDGSAEARGARPRALADADRGRGGSGVDDVRDGDAEPHRGGPQLADAEGEPVGSRLREGGTGRVGGRRPRDGGGPDGDRPGWLEPVADAARERVEGNGPDWFVLPPASTLAAVLGRYGAGPGRDQWAVEPGMGRMAHGVARRGDRLWTLGNGVVPQVGEVIGWLVRLAAEA